MFHALFEFTRQNALRDINLSNAKMNFLLALTLSLYLSCGQRLNKLCLVSPNIELNYDKNNEQ